LHRVGIEAEHDLRLAPLDKRGEPVPEALDPTVTRIVKVLGWSRLWSRLSMRGSRRASRFGHDREEYDRRWISLGSLGS
jgi:hypothetical protein